MIRSVNTPILDKVLASPFIVSILLSSWGLLSQSVTVCHYLRILLTILLSFEASLVYVAAGPPHVAAYIIPGGMPPSGMPPGGAVGVFSSLGMSETKDSVIITITAMLLAFSSALLTTLVGSVIPLFTISP